MKITCKLKVEKKLNETAEKPYGFRMKVEKISVDVPKEIAKTRWEDLGITDCYCRVFSETSCKRSFTSVQEAEEVKNKVIEGVKKKLKEIAEHYTQLDRGWGGEETYVLEVENDG